MSKTSNDMGIYAIENLVNGKYYIGSSVSMAKRWNDHVRDLLGGTHHSRYLQRAWNKYGPAMFRFYCLEVIEQEEELVKREQVWISEFMAADARFGYNISPTAGSQLGFIFTEESKAKMGKGQKKRYEDPAERVRHSDAIKKGLADPACRTNISDAQKKRFADPESRIKASSDAKQRWENPASRVKLSESQKKRFADPVERIKGSEAAKKIWENQASRVKLSESQKKRFADPVERAKLSDSQKKRYANPAERKKLSDAQKKRFAHAAALRL